MILDNTQPSLLDTVADAPAEWTKTKRLATALRNRAAWHKERAENMRTEPRHEHSERWASVHDGIRWELERLADDLDRRQR